MPADHPFRIYDHLHVGVIHLRAGRAADALRELEVAKAILKAAGISSNLEDKTRVELTFARALYARGSRERARRVARQARADLPTNEVAEGVRGRGPAQGAGAFFT